MRHENCSDWDYETHPNVGTVTAFCKQIVSDLKSGAGTHQTAIDDTREHHRQMFEHVVPAACPYLAGNYRGSQFPCLATYPIFFGAPPGRREGEKPINVDVKMASFHIDLREAVNKHQAAVAKAKNNTERAVLFNRLIAVVAAMLTRFYNIHPYANGNGHTGRLLAWVVLTAFGYPPKKLTLDDSPKGYYDLFDLYRANKKKPLENFLLNCVLQ